MKKGIYIILAAVIVVFAFAGNNQLSTAFAQPEIENLFLTRVVGIDRDGTGNIVLTLAQKSSSGGGQSGGSGGGGSQGGGSEKPMIYTGSGATIDEALNDMEKFSALRIFWGHVDFILLGDGAMKQDVANYLDFFVRRIELGFNVDVFGVKGGSAKDLITNGNGGNKLIFDKLQQLSSYSALRLIASKVSFLKLVTQLDIKEMSPVIPCVIAQKTDALKDDPKEPTVVLAGYAILTREGMLLSYADDAVSRGISFLNNEVKSGQYNLRQNSNKLTAVELITSDTKTKITNKNNQLKVKITISASANVIESTEKIISDKNGHFTQLQDALSGKIKEEVQKAIKLAQDSKQDFFGLHAALYRSSPKQWKEKYSKNWPEIFSKIPIEIKVESDIHIRFGTKESIQANKTEEE